MKQLRVIDIKQAVSWAGTVLMVLALLFISRRLLSMWHDLELSILANPWVLGVFLLVVLAEGTAIILASINFRALLANISGVVVAPPLATMTYARSNLYKYIPGGVMYVLGRNQMAIETEALGHGKVFLATALEGVFIAVAAFILSTIYTFDYAIYYFRQLDLSPLAGLILGLALLAAIPLLYCFRHRLLTILSGLKKDSTVLRPTVLAKRLAFALGQTNLSAGTFLSTLIILGQPMTVNLGTTVMGLFILSWLAGFLTPGAPSGLGVREAVLLMFLSGTLDEGILLLTVVMHRALLVVGDVAAYLMVLAYTRVKGR